MCFFVLLITSWLLAAPAFAQDSSTDSDHDARLKQAVAAYEGGSLDEARTLFETLHAQKPTARTLRALGVIAFRQQRYAEASTLLAESLTSSVKPLTEELAQGARTLLDQSRAAHEAEGKPTGSQEPTAASEPRAAAKALMPLAEPQDHAVVGEPSAAHPAAKAGEAMPVQHRRETRLQKAGWIVMGAAGAAGVMALIATAIGAKRLGDIEDRCRANEDGTCSKGEGNRLMRAKNMDLWSGLAIGGAAGAGLLAGTGTWLLVDGYWRDRGQPGAHGMMLSLQRRF